MKRQNDYRESKRALAWVLGLCLGCDAALLAQDQPPAFTKQPQSQIVAYGSDATFSVELQPNPLPVTFQWYRGLSVVGGATNATLVLSNVGTMQGGTYKAIATNPAGSTPSDEAGLTVVRNTSITGSLGTRIILTVLTYGAAVDSRQWRFNGRDLEGATGMGYLITNATPADVGQYSHVVSNAAGSFELMLPPNVVDPTFTKITTGPLVTDRGCTWHAAWGDYDGDGFGDLYVGRYKVGTSALYRNNRDDTFAGATAPFPSIADVWGIAAWGDLDNDGWMDLVATRYGKTSFCYFNNGDGSFASTELPNYPPNSPWCVSIADYDRDGWGDLYLPIADTGNVNLLYRNDGDRTFTRMQASEVGVIASVSAFGSASWADYDEDGDLDVHMRNHRTSSTYLCRNDGGGQFVLVTNAVTTDSIVAPLVSSWGDYDNDGRVDLFVTGTPHQALYRNLGGGQFQRVDFPTGPTGWNNSVTWADYDNDGFLDLFLTVGSLGSANWLYRGRGDGTFEVIKTGSPVVDLASSSAAYYEGLWFDYDNDGFLDLYVIHGDDPGTVSVTNFLYRNNGNGNGWLKVKLAGTASSRDGNGAKVRVLATYAGQPRWQRRDASSDYSGNQLIAHVGLGDATVVDTVRIEWPSGTVQELHGIAPKQTLTVTEPARLTPTGRGTFQIRCWKGQKFEVQASADLSAWMSLGVVTNETGTLLYTDPEAGTVERRFYRVVAN